MSPEERERLAKELRDNDFITIDDVRYPVKSIALLTWHNLDELKDRVETDHSTVVGKIEEVLRMLDGPDGFVRRREWDAFRVGFRVMAASIVTLVIGLVTAGIMLAG